MAATPATSRPTWQRNSFFQFFASLKLAVVLLAVLIIGAIAGTLYESSFDAKVARAYVYGAPWFNFWLVFLALNLAASALSRWPWKKHHVAFLITHLGIITLLAGSLIGRIFGIEGTITIFKGEPPSNRLLIDQHQLSVHDSDRMIKGYDLEFIHRLPTPEKPWDLGPLAGGARLRVVGYAPSLSAKLNPKPVSDGGAAAVHFTIKTKMMNQHLDSWLLADDQQHGAFQMGLATIELKKGGAPTTTTPPASPQPEPSKVNDNVEIEETIFAFTKAPEDQVTRVVKGGSSGAKVQLAPPQNGNKGTVIIQLLDKTWSFDVGENLTKDLPLDGSTFSVRILNYWPDFRIDNGKPASVSDQPNNPAVVVTIHGHGVPVSTNASGAHGNTSSPAPGAAPNMPAEGETSPNRLTLFIADDNTLTYELASRKLGHSTGKLETDKPLTTGWADWELTVDQIMPHAQEWMDFNPVAENAPLEGDTSEGVRIQIQHGSETSDQWIPAGWQMSVPSAEGDIHVAYGWKQTPLPIALELLDFEVQRNEGNDSPAGFKSTVRVTDLDGQSVTGQCWMNNPFSFPGEWWRPWTGLTYKMSQASWNPDNLDQSTIQILRDPGWLLKWIGSLLIVCGIFLLFYVKQFRRPSASTSPTATAASTVRKPDEALVPSGS